MVPVRKAGKGANRIGVQRRVGPQVGGESLLWRGRKRRELRFGLRGICPSRLVSTACVPEDQNTALFLCQGFQEKARQRLVCGRARVDQLLARLKPVEASDLPEGGSRSVRVGTPFSDSGQHGQQEISRSNMGLCKRVLQALFLDRSLLVFEIPWPCPTRQAFSRDADLRPVDPLHRPFARRGARHQNRLPAAVGHRKVRYRAALHAV